MENGSVPFFTRNTISNRETRFLYTEGAVSLLVKKKKNLDKLKLTHEYLASVGLYAIQLAHLSGYKVATVASPRNHPLLKDLGADVVFDVGQRNINASQRRSCELFF